MSGPVDLVEIWRGPFLESVHQGHAVVCDAAGQVRMAFGNPNAHVLPRSSAKMIQALPLIQSGAAAAHGLTSAQLALSCASHNGAFIHTKPVQAWLDSLELGDDDLRCGGQIPNDTEARNDLVKRDLSPCQIHNNCSGKHAGFLTLTKHLGAGPEYIEADHPVQQAVLETFERLTDETSPGFGIDGCSAPNFACTLKGMARAMAQFASAPTDSAEARLIHAMTTHPELVAGEGRACTRLMRAMEGRVALKTGAEGFFAAILPDLKLGVALKIADGATRAAECAITQILINLGALNADHPEARRYVNAPILNRRAVETGRMKPAEHLRSTSAGLRLC